MTGFPGRHLLLLLLLSACGDAGAGPAATARIDTLPDGQVRVENTGAPAWPSGTAWRLEEDLRLGTAREDGPEAERFIGIVSVRTDARGRIYVLEAGSQEIRVFEPSGALSHTMGGEGQGPGEISGAEGMAFGPDDTLWVLDGRAGRYSTFAPDGTFLEVRRRLFPFGWYEGFGFLADGRFVDLLLDRTAGPERVVLRPVRLEPGFREADTLPALSYRQEMMPDGDGFQLFFSGGLALALDRAGGLWVAHTREYRIYRRTLEGDTTLVFDLPEEPPPVLDTDREEVRSLLGPSPRGGRARYLDALPETKPIVYKILPDGAGLLYVLVDVEGKPSSMAVDVFRESGVYLGRMSLPTSMSLVRKSIGIVTAHATPEHLYVVVEDELDVPYVSRLRIVRE